MFSVTSVGTGNLFMLPFAKEVANRWDVPDELVGEPLMFGSVEVDGQVIPVLATLARRQREGDEGWKQLRLVFGQSYIKYVGELWPSGRRGWHDGELAEGERPNDPDYRGYVSLAPRLDDQEPSEVMHAFAGCLGIEGRRVRNADGSVRIVLTIADQVIEDSDQLRAGVAV